MVVKVFKFVILTIILGGGVLFGSNLDFGLAQASDKVRYIIVESYFPEPGLLHEGNIGKTEFEKTSGGKKEIIRVGDKIGSGEWVIVSYGTIRIKSCDGVSVSLSSVSGTRKFSVSEYCSSSKGQLDINYRQRPGAIEASLDTYSWLASKHSQLDQSSANFSCVTEKTLTLSESDLNNIFSVSDEIYLSLEDKSIYFKGFDNKFANESVLHSQGDALNIIVDAKLGHPSLNIQEASILGVTNSELLTSQGRQFSYPVKVVVASDVYELRGYSPIVSERNKIIELERIEFNVGDLIVTKVEHHLCSNNIPDYVIKDIQLLLSSFGYLDGKVDGVWDDTLQFSIAKYQSENGLRATGYLDRNTLESLGLID